MYEPYGELGSDQDTILDSRYPACAGTGSAGMTKITEITEKSVDDSLILCLLYYIANSLGDEPHF